MCPEFNAYQVIENLVPYDPAHLEALLAPHGVHNHVSMYANEVLAVQDGVLVLARRIDDLSSKVLIPVAYDFAEGVLDSGVIGIDKVAIDVLDSE